MDKTFTSWVLHMDIALVSVPDFGNSELIPNEQKILPSTQIGLAFIQLKNQSGHPEPKTFNRLSLYTYTKPYALRSAHILSLYPLQ